MHSLVQVGQLTLTILMELVLRMVPPANIFGALLLGMRKLAIVHRARVSLGALVEAAFLHLWARTTSVNQA